MSCVDRPDPVADLPRIGSVPVCTEYFVRGVAVPIRAHERAHVFPDNVTPARHFEEAPPLTFADQGISAGEPLCAADVRTEKGEARLAAIFPHCLARLRVDFNNAGKRIGCDVAAIGE